MSSFKSDVTKAVYTVKDEVGGAMTSVKDGVGRTVSTMKDDVERAVDSVRMWTWRQWIRPVFVIFYSLFVCVAFPILIWDMYYHEQYLQAFSWLTAGLCALVAIGVSGYGILSHLVYFTRPNQQRYIVRILLMVPIYSIDSSIALRVPQAAIFLDSIRACYQAFVVYCFLFYLLHYLSEHYDLDVHLSSKPQMKSPKPFCCFKPGPNSKLVYRCRNGVLNFVIIGPLTTLTAIIFYYVGDEYETGNFAITGAWFWLTLISAISQVWAMYCLVIFYQATSEETAPLKPLPQMLCVKFAIFGSFFQQIIISLIVSMTYTCISNQSMASSEPAQCAFSKSEMASEIHNFCIAIEMAIVSVIHLYAFSHKPYKAAGEPLTFRLSCRRICDYSDMKDDIRVHSGRFIQSIKNRGKGKDDEEEVIRDGDTAMKVISCETIQDADLESSSSSEGDDHRPTAGCRDEDEKNDKEDGAIANHGIQDTSRPEKDENLTIRSDAVPPSDQSLQLAQQLQAFAVSGEHNVRGKEATNRFDARPSVTDIDEFGMSKSFQTGDDDVSRTHQLIGNEFTNNSIAGLVDFHHETSLPSSWSLDQTLRPPTKQNGQKESEDWMMIHPPSEGSLNVVINPWDQMNADDATFKPQVELLDVTNDHSVHYDNNLVVADINASHDVELDLGTLQVKSGFDDDFLPSRDTKKDVDHPAKSTFPDVIEDFDDAFTTDC